jgi:hypothetical protein
MAAPVASAGIYSIQSSRSDPQPKTSDAAHINHMIVKAEVKCPYVCLLNRIVIVFLMSVVCDATWTFYESAR